MSSIAIVPGLGGVTHPSRYAVVIDVFRAMTVAVRCVTLGAERIFCTGTIEAAHQLKATIGSAVLIGEVESKKPATFDFGNSPSELIDSQIKGQTVILKTSHGTVGILGALEKAERVFAAGFVNASAIATLLSAEPHADISLHPIESVDVNDLTEDMLCAIYIQSRILGSHAITPLNFSAIKNYLRHHENGARFFDKAKPWLPEADFHACLDVDARPVVLEAKRHSKDSAELVPLGAVAH